MAYMGEYHLFFSLTSKSFNRNRNSPLSLLQHEETDIFVLTHGNRMAHRL